MLWHRAGKSGAVLSARIGRTVNALISEAATEENPRQTITDVTEIKM